MKLLSGKKILLSLNNLYEETWTILLFWLIPLFPILYLIYGKTSMAKIMFSNNSYVACGRCARFCPKGAIVMKNFFGKRRPYWTYQCENCMRCMGCCIKNAVEASHLWSIILCVIFTSSGMAIVNSYLINVFLEPLYYILVLMVSYWFFWAVLRIPAITAFFSLTTLTHYYKRYHEPQSTLHDLARAEMLAEK